MKTSWDKLMRYAPEREYPLAPLQLDEAARIVEQTMHCLLYTSDAADE